MQPLNNVTATGTFELQCTLAPFTDEFKLVEIMRLVNSKLSDRRPIFKLRVNKRYLIISINDERSVHLKNGAGGLYVPKVKDSPLGITLGQFERYFKPPTYTVSDSCVEKVCEFINEWKILSKNRLKDYKFAPKIIDGKLEIKVYKNNVFYETTSFEV